MKTSFIVKPLPINDIDKNTTIYQQIGDIALCLFILIADDGERTYTMKAPIRVLKALDISKEELIKSALVTTSWYYPARVVDPEHTLKGESPFLVMENISSYKPSDDAQQLGFELTNTGYSNGVVSLFYPYTCKNLAWQIQDDFYAAPNGYYAYTIYPKKMFDFKAATHTVEYMNKRHDGYFLSSCILYYSKKKNKLIVCKKEYNKDAYIF